MLPSQVEASGTTLVAGLRAMDVNSQYCSQREGSPGYTPDTTSAGWSSLVRDTGGADISCVKVYADPGPSTKDVRICIQLENNGTYFSSVCTSWASEGTNGDSVSSWSAGKDNDGIRISVENRDMPSGQTISDVQLGIQLSKKNSGICNQPGTTQYTPIGGGWSSYAVDGGNGGYGGDFDCTKVYLNSTITTAPSPIYPTVTLTADQNPITTGGSTTLRWTSSNASSCSAIAGSGFSVSSTNGSDGISPTSSQTYTIRCYSSTGHSSSKSVNMVVNAATAPTASLSASSNSVSSGSTVTLTWSSTNATSCSGTGSGFATGNATSGTDTVNPTVDTTYTLTCTGTGGTGTDSETITIIVTGPPTVTLTATPSTFASGSSSTLTWSSSGADTCSSYGSPSFSTGNATSGSVSISPTTNTTYTIRCYNAYGYTNATATVTVTASGGTDLISATPTLYSGSLTAGSSLRFSSVVTNQGTVDTSTYFYTLFQIDVDNNGSYDWTYDSYNGTLAAANSATQVATSWTALGGTHSVRACADTHSSGGSSNNRITESDETNNCSAAYTFTVSAADLVTATPTISPTSPIAGNTITFSAVVTNQGSVDAGSSPTLFELDINNDGSYDWTGNSGVGSINAGSTRTYTPNGANSTQTTWTATAGTHTIRACADNYYPDGNFWDNRVTESDENNNCATYTFTVVNPVPTATLEVQNTTTGGAYTTNDISISNDDQIALRWSSTNATSCSGSNFSAGGTTSGTQSSITEPSPGSSTTYTLVCTGAGGTGSDPLTVTTAALSPPTLTSTQSAEPVLLGSSATFNWNLNGNTPAQCSFVGSGAPGSISAQTGSFNTTVQGETRVTLSCPGGNVSVTVRVIPKVYEE
ncbi:hypothetical protein GW943_02990 [Candidatus Parcubacteria bacterium]|nr:hypothetical protein [Candidatus Parcubacteria bacterium]